MYRSNYHKVVIYSWNENVLGKGNIVLISLEIVTVVTVQSLDVIIKV